jgi:3-oxoacyl-[acyl-carrier protein] reductase
MKLKGATVLVTGGSDGLGFSLSKALVAKGATVHIFSRSQANLDKAAKALPSAHIHQGDVSDPQSVEVVVKKIGQIDILVNNAGVWLEGPLQDYSIEEIDKTIGVNLNGVIYATRAVLPSMLKRDDGFILNVSSTSGLIGRNDQSVYAATKFGVTGFTKSLQDDLMKTNIKVAGFYPGGMATKLFAKAGNAKDNTDWMNTDEVAEVMVFMLEHDETLLMNQVVLNKRQAKVQKVT